MLKMLNKNITNKVNPISIKSKQDNQGVEIPLKNGKLILQRNLLFTNCNSTLPSLFSQTKADIVEDMLLIKIPNIKRCCQRCNSATFVVNSGCWTGIF